MDLAKIMAISAADMKVQTTRMRVVAENLANADTLPDKPGVDPYRRKIVTFESVLDEARGVETVAVNRIGFDRSSFGRRYDPGHPGADKNGFVKVPNVKGLIEMMDLRAAQRSYEANLSVIQISKAMVQSAMQILA